MVEENGQITPVCVDRRHGSSQIDRGWAWVVLLASFLLQTLSMGICLSVGVFIVEWKESFNDHSLSAVAWVGSICGGVLFITGIYLDTTAYKIKTPISYYRLT